MRWTEGKSMPVHGNGDCADLAVPQAAAFQIIRARTAGGCILWQVRFIEGGARGDLVGHLYGFSPATLAVSAD